MKYLKTSHYLGILLIIIGLIIFSTYSALAATGITVGNNTLNIGASENLLYGIMGETSSTTAGGILIQKPSGTDIFKINSSGSGYFAGNVGIGTTAPSFPLTVQSGNHEILVLQRPASTTSWAVWEKFRLYNASNAFVDYGYIGGGITTNTAGSHTGYLGFGTAQAGSLVETMKLSSAGNLQLDGSLSSDGTGDNYFIGNVGIGTTDPIEILTLANGFNSVNLQLRDTTFLGHSGSGHQTLLGYNAKFNSSDTSNTAIAATFRTDGYAAIQMSGNDGMRFFINNGIMYGGESVENERMLLNSDGYLYLPLGNLAVGTTSANIRLTVDNGGSGNAIDVLSSKIANLATPTTSTDAANKSYVDTAISGLGGVNYWALSGSNLYATNTSWNVGIGTTTPSTNLHIYDATGKQSTALLKVQGAGTNPWSSAIIQMDRNTPGRVSGLYFSTNNVTDWWTGTYYNAGASQSNFGIGTDYNAANQKMVITSAGNVGIGTTTPSNPLQVQVGAAGRAFRVYSVSDFPAIASTNGDLFVGAVQFMGSTIPWSDISIALGSSGRRWSSFYSKQITDNGTNVGIGTTTISTKLTIDNGGAGNAIDVLSSKIVNLATPAADTDAANKSYVDGVAAAINNAGYWNISGSNLYASSTTWNLGIGTTAPVTKLTVNGAIHSFTNDSDTIMTGVPANDTQMTLIGKGGYWGLRQAVNHSYNLDVYNSGSPLTAMTVLQNGSIGIGTSSPTYKLSIATDGSYNKNQGLTFDNAIGIYRVASGQLAIGNGTGDTIIETGGIIRTANYYRISPANSATNPTYTFNTDLDTGIFNPAANSLAITASGTEAMRIIASGNVGIGTTNPTSLLTLGNGGILIPNGNIDISSGGISIIRNSSNTGLSVTQNGTGLIANFLDGAISAMSIIDGGNVGIGTTTVGTKLTIDNGGTGNAIDVLNSKIANLATPTLSTDAVNKSYVDTALASGWTLTVPSVDATFSGEKVVLTAADTVVQGDICYINASGQAKLARADAIANANAVMMATSAINAGNSGTFLMRGWARVDAWSALNAGNLVYLSAATAGKMTSTAPSATNNVIQILGVAHSSKLIYFNPQLVQIEHN